MRKHWPSIKGIFFGVGVALCLAAFSPSVAEAQPQSTCDDCDHSWGFAACCIGCGGVYQSCFTESPNYCGTYGYCWLPWQQAVDLTGTAVGQNAEDPGSPGEGDAVTRSCDSAVTDWALSAVEAAQHRRELRIVVITEHLDPSSLRASGRSLVDLPLERP